MPPHSLRSWLGCDAPSEVRHLLNLCPLHQSTPLRQLDSLAQQLGLASVFAKDEGGRLGLGSFKALGGAYAVAELVLRWASEHLGRSVRPEEIMSIAVREAVKDRTLCCATDGNHGRSVAAGARLFGCKAVIFVHQNVAEQRRAVLKALDAQVVEVLGTYDDSVDMCAEAARENGWQLVSDTCWNSDREIPARVMRGYTVLVDEALSQMDLPPTHVFVPGGVGGLAGAVAGHLADVLGKARPMVVVVEPDRAGCLIASALAGRPVEVPANDPTVMAMLECYRPSEAAWPILDHYVDAFMTLPDAAAVGIVQLLANPSGTDPVIAAGISGGVGLAGLVAATQDPHVRDQLGLNHHSRVLTIITEGADAPPADQSTLISVQKKEPRAMIMDHLELSTNKFDEMCAFYDAALAPLGVTRIVPGSPAGYGQSGDLPFWVRIGDNRTINAHYAFSCASRALVHEAFEAAKAIGGTGLREPKIHPHIEANYYAGYACDPDGHLVEFVCRKAET